MKPVAQIVVNPGHGPKLVRPLSAQGQVRGIQPELVRRLGIRIVSGLWEPGFVLPREERLLAELGISRTSLREAFRVLAAKGLIEPRQRIGTTVCARERWNMLDSDVLAWLGLRADSASLRRQLLDLRTMIEPQVAMMAATNAGASERSALRKAYEAMVASSSDRMAYYIADKQFHQSLFAATANPFVQALGQTVLAVLDLSFAIQSRSLIDPSRGLALHGKVCTAVEKGSVQAARRSMLALLAEAESELSRIPNPPSRRKKFSD